MKYILPILTLVVLCGCATTAEKARDNLKTGMSKEQVMDALGFPDNMMDESPPYIWCYHSSPNVNIWFDENGKVARWTTGQLSGGSSSANTQLGEINSSLRDIDSTLEWNQIMNMNNR